MRREVSRRRPAPFTANWLNPLLFSWVIDPDILAPLVPDALEIDHWEGNAYISLVGLRLEGVRLFGVPGLVPGYDEINLRFYVRRKDTRGGAKPGVVFVRQMAPSRVAVWGARAIHREPFVFAPVGHRFDLPDSEHAAAAVRVAYRWNCGGRLHCIAAEADTAPAMPAPGSLDEFLTGRYWGYNGKPGKRTRAYQLTRPAWPVRSVSRWDLDCDFASVYVEPFAGVMRDAPASVALAAGSRASVGLPTMLPVAAGNVAPHAS